MAKQKHIFALYDPQLPCQSIRSSRFLYTISDAALYHRIMRVLRLDVGEICILFNGGYYAVFRIDYGDQKIIKGECAEWGRQEQYTPALVCILPLLKREDTDEAVHGLVQAGVNEIYLVTTATTQRHWRVHERARLEQVIIGACEQAKYFSLPLLHDPMPLEQAVLLIRKKEYHLIFCDPAGVPFADGMRSLSIQNSYAFIVGPESDLADHEKQFLTKAGALFLRLTPTILRAQYAACFIAASVRSWFFVSKK